MSAPASSRTDAAGFDGEMSGLGLADVIQLSVQNRFSGCITVEHEGRAGVIFLRDGNVVHAEQGGVLGEPAFYEILSWPGGRFSTEENVATTQSTIKRGCNFLLLEAHRLMDERKVARAAAPPPLPAPPAPPARTGWDALVEQLRPIPGVLQALLLGKDGQDVGDAGYAGEVLSAQALYLAMISRQAAPGLGASELRSAVVQGTSRHVLLLASRNHYLAVLVDGGAEVGAVEAAVRRVLAPPRPAGRPRP